jgi:hypothetical protein
VKPRYRVPLRNFGAAALIFLIWGLTGSGVRTRASPATFWTAMGFRSSVRVPTWGASRRCNPGS